MGEGNDLSHGRGELRGIGAGVQEAHGELARKLQRLQFSHQAMAQSRGEPPQDREADRIDVVSVRVPHRAVSPSFGVEALAALGAQT